jgi:hypothetical protein
MLDDVNIKDENVKELKISSRNDWGEKSYTIDADKSYVTIKRGDSEERVLTLKPEIFPKFTKIVTFDVTAKHENGNVTVLNEERIEKLFKKGEISSELKTNLKKSLGEASKI